MPSLSPSKGLLLAPVACLVLASCSSSSGTKNMSDFISGANAVCTTSAASSAAVPQPSVSSLTAPKTTDLPAIATYLGKQVAVLQSTISRMKAMGTPPAKQSSWNKGIAAIQQSADDAQAAQTAAAASSQQTYITALSRIVADGAAIDAAFGDFGATACTSGTASPKASPSSSTTTH